MLKYKAIYPETLELLKKLMKIPGLDNFYLVGGTSLALRIGHRISVDLDLFSHIEFSTQELISEIEIIGSMKIIGEARNTLNVVIDGVEVDIIRHNYPLLEEIKIIDGLRLISKKDIAAMKLSAIARRGSKKDFYDVYFILQEFSTEELFEFYKLKYESREMFHLVKSLVYFGEADLEPAPEMLIDVDWNNVKSFFNSLALKY
ncbi:MAG: nucleotidyl transferase AbiEii/AbiGii toxin family protein [Bacteroidetes bacterium]|nr:nucleotidyl transferase AbiEii/AbiGii toxin family protein [Bacteroidota bacterium]MBL7105128.1 nucleotidyl transferase AbiEii/AbiGii toxin family protein [Bacteroidales bacterium]